MPIVPTFSDHIAAAVKAERNRAGLTQEQLGQRLGWTRNDVAALENLRRPVRADDIPELCRGLGIGFDRLVVDVDPDDAAALRL